MSRHHCCEATGEQLIETQHHTQKDHSLTFEEALAQLNTLVQKLESGQLPLEESVTAFEQAVKLSRHCEHTLDQAEQRLKILDDQQPDDAPAQSQS